MVREYINYISHIKGMSANTSKAYYKDLMAFVKWAGERNLRWSTIRRDDIDLYVTYLSSQGKSPSTTNRMLSAISGIYNYMRRMGKDVENPCRYESRRKLAKTTPNTISNEELKNAYLHSHGVARVMLGLLCCTGIRLQELLDIRWEDINFERNTIAINGKGAKGRIAYATSESLETLKIYKSHNEVSGKIFTLSQREVREIIYKALKPYCNAPQLSPHAIRHSYATNIAINGGNVVTLAVLLGHNNISTTQRYIDTANVAAQQLALNNQILN